MATYAIGDIQGCFDSLQALLSRLPLEPERDRLWLTGDLVNRGPKSLEVLRWARRLGERAVTVLGNHDLHLCAVAAGVAAPRPRDTLEAILAAPDRDELISWLESRPLVYRQGGFVLVHAGLLPSWTVDDACRLAGEVEALLRSARRREVLAAGRGRAPRFSEALRGAERWRAILAGLVRVRAVALDGAPCEGFSGPPAEIPAGCVPWYAHPGRRSRDACVVFGHWAALGLHLGDDCMALDSGCVWGGALTAVRLEDRRVFQQPALER